MNSPIPFPPVPRMSSVPEDVTFVGSLPAVSQPGPPERHGVSLLMGLAVILCVVCTVLFAFGPDGWRWSVWATSLCGVALALVIAVSLSERRRRSRRRRDWVAGRLSMRNRLTGPLRACYVVLAQCVLVCLFGTGAFLFGNESTNAVAGIACLLSMELMITAPAAFIGWRLRESWPNVPVLVDSEGLTLAGGDRFAWSDLTKVRVREETFDFRFGTSIVTVNDPELPGTSISPLLTLLLPGVGVTSFMSHLSSVGGRVDLESLTICRFFSWFLRPLVESPPAPEAEDSVEAEPFPEDAESAVEQEPEIETYALSTALPELPTTVPQVVEPKPNVEFSAGELAVFHPAAMLGMLLSWGVIGLTVFRFHNELREFLTFDARLPEWTWIAAVGLVALLSGVFVWKSLSARYTLREAEGERWVLTERFSVCGVTHHTRTVWLTRASRILPKSPSDGRVSPVLFDDDLTVPLRGRVAYQLTKQFDIPTELPTELFARTLPIVRSHVRHGTRYALRGEGNIASHLTIESDLENEYGAADIALELSRIEDCYISLPKKRPASLGALLASMADPTLFIAAIANAKQMRRQAKSCSVLFMLRSAHAGTQGFESFELPDRETAEALASLLRGNTDIDVRVE